MKEWNKKVILISIMVSLSILLILNFTPVLGSNEGFSTDFTQEISSEQEAYVNKSSPDVNYSYLTYFFPIVGNYCETYIKFDLNLAPEGAEGLHFIIRNYGIYETYSSIDDLEINVILVDSNWNSSEITWNNKPEHKEIIDTVNVSEIFQGWFLKYYNLEKTIDITNLFHNNLQNDISFCVNITNNNFELEGNVYLTIQLIWVNKVVILSYNNIYSSVTILSLLFGTLFFMRKGIYVCSKCKAKRKYSDKTCFACGNKFEEDIIIKSKDYYLVLILIWFFMLFEGMFLVAMLNQITWLPWHQILYSTPSLVLWNLICSIPIYRNIKKYKVILSIRVLNKNQADLKRDIFEKTFKYICSQCGEFSYVNRDYCETCGAKGAIREASNQDYKSYWERKTK